MILKSKDRREKPLIFIRRSFVDSLAFLLGDDSILLGLWPLKKEFCLLAKPLRPSKASQQSTKKDSFFPTSEMEVSLLSFFALFTSALCPNPIIYVESDSHLIPLIGLVFSVINLPPVELMAIELSF